MSASLLVSPRPLSSCERIVPKEASVFEAAVAKLLAADQHLEVADLGVGCHSSGEDQARRLGQGHQLGTGGTLAAGGGMSLRIKVGAFVGRYNLNSGIWEDDK